MDLSTVVKVCAFCFLFGVLLMFDGATSLGIRKMRGRPAKVGMYRKEEQQAPAEIRIGTVLAVVGFIALSVTGLIHLL